MPPASFSHLPYAFDTTFPSLFICLPSFLPYFLPSLAYLASFLPSLPSFLTLALAFPHRRERREEAYLVGEGRTWWWWWAGLSCVFCKTFFHCIKSMAAWLIGMGSLSPLLPALPPCQTVEPPDIYPGLSILHSISCPWQPFPNLPACLLPSSPKHAHTHY